MANQPREFYYKWEWDLKSRPELLWPLASDTNHFNMLTGLPTVQHRIEEGRLPNGRRRLRFYRLGVRVDWEEEPFEWVRPYRFGVVRHYTSGPVAHMRVLAELERSPAGGTHLTYEVWAAPRNLLGLLAIPVQIGILSARDFDRGFRKYDELAYSGRLTFDMHSQPVFEPGGESRLDKLLGPLKQRVADPALVDKLADTLRYSDELTLSRLRPYVLADYWKSPRRDVLTLFLEATRAGIVNIQWNLLCPLCRGAKNQTGNLSNLTSQAHCDTCNIDFTAGFDRLVEVTFRPNDSIRRAAEDEFCVAGPQVTPHIEVQQLLNPGESRVLTPLLDPGRYRLRTLEQPGSEFLDARDGGLQTLTLRATPSGWTGGEQTIAPLPELRLVNDTPAQQLFILERVAWTEQAVTAADVTSMQLFRDLFASQALRPDEQFSVGALTVVFTDLRDSTRMYQEIGDAFAFGMVMNHFDVLKDFLNARDGTIVKTIGDAIMGVFQRPVNALQAMLEAQTALQASQDVGRPLSLKVGIHSGPCIAVNLNDRLDYFGSTVNIAARLEAQSDGKAVIISDEIRNDPEVIEFLNGNTLRVEPFATTLKGFDAQEFTLWRVWYA